MKPLAKEIEAIGHTPYLFDYKSRSKTIEGHAEDLLELLETLDETPHFVTHSLGGLIVRAALNHPRCPPKAKGGMIIMMAPPNRGSKTAHLLNHFPFIRAIFGSKVGWQLLNYREKEIEQLGPLPCCTIIAGSRDWKVRIAETRPQNIHSHYVVKSGHCFIMRNKESLQIVKNQLSAKSD